MAQLYSSIAMRWVVAFFMGILVCIVAVSPCSASFPDDGSTHPSGGDAASAILRNHVPINIEDDNQLINLAISNGWSGKGSHGDPIAIENLRIDAHGGQSAISISGTTLSFVIRGCECYNTSVPSEYRYNAYGIYLANNIDATVESCFSHSNFYGIVADENTILRYNNCSENKISGIFAGSNTSVIGNICSSNSYGIGYGFYWDSTSSSGLENLWIENNSCFGNSVGLAFGAISHSTITNNNFSNNSGSGIAIGSPSGGDVLESNICNCNGLNGMLLCGNGVLATSNICNNNGNGIHLEDSIGAILAGNYCSNNNNSGIYSPEGWAVNSYNRPMKQNNLIQSNNLFENNYGIMDASWGNTYSHNYIVNNIGFGIISSGKDNRFYSNILTNNNGAWSGYVDHAQAKDSGSGNLWYTQSQTCSYGNYWSDWTTPDLNDDGIVDDPILITGSSGSIDNYPLAREPRLPTAPLNLTCSHGDRSISLTSTNTIENGIAPVTEYIIYRSATDGWVRIGTTSTNSFIEHDLNVGSQYHYEVSAVNAVGEGPNSSIADCTGATLPGAPTDIKVWTEGTSVLISWAAPADAGTPIKGYNVFRGSASNTWTYLGMANGTSYRDSNATEGSTCRYQVCAVNDVGIGALATSGSVTVPKSFITSYGELIAYVALGTIVVTILSVAIIKNRKL